MLANAYIFGLGSDSKKKKSSPAPKPVLKPKLPDKASGQLPSWLPWAIGAAGVGVVIVLLLTSKKKD